MVLTEVFVLPDVAQHDVAADEHGHAPDPAALHVDVLVVVRLVAWGGQTVEQRLKG